GRADGVIRVVAILLGAVPLFWFGLLLQYFLAVKAPIFPVSGVLNAGVQVHKITGFTTLDALLSGNWSGFVDAVEHLFLPALTLAIPFMAFVIRIVRAAMVTALTADHVTVAHAKGVPNRRVLVRHALRNCLAPIVNLLGLQFGWMIGGAVLIESVFSRPGIGNYLTQAIQQKDTFAALGVVVFTGAIIAVTNLVVDVIQLLADVRVRVQQLGVAA
ncbi:MAG: ABC transporter permease, partial [Actinobacteria bacterium]|nr:ABC transporter permease [Actinomycetota bacterium]